MDIFHLVTDQPNITTQEIIEKLELNQSTAYRLVNTLEQNHLIMKSKDNGYVVSDLLVAKLQNNNLLKADYALWQSVSFMDKLSKDTGETTYIGMLQGAEVVITQAVLGKYATRTHHEIGNRLSIHVDAIGKCILAFQDHETQSRIIANMSLDKRTEHTITSQELFLEELSHINKNGYSLDNEEGEIGVRCIGAPIRKGNKVIAAIAMSGPSVRLCKDKDSTHIALVKACAEGISQLLT
ncbi:IclR family transcriptional regulator [Paenibacillaceae bacterium]|nr:IclR family transcriptional regulator [Paenibacillaceae bacterium]